MSGVSLRPATDADVPRLAALARAAYGHYVERIGGPPRPMIDNVAVDPSHQGIGVGRALLEHAEVVARRQGFDSIYLYTHEKMTENQALYSRIGYAEYDRRTHGEACLVYMRKQL